MESFWQQDVIDGRPTTPLITWVCLFRLIARNESLMTSPAQTFTDECTMERR